MQLPDHVAALGIVLILVAVATAVVTAWRPGPALVAFLGLTASPRLVVAAVDHGVLALPPGTRTTLQAYAYNRFWLLDGALLAGIVTGAAVRACHLRARRPVTPVVVAAVAFIGVALAAALRSPDARAAGFGLMLTICGPVVLLVVWSVGPSRRIAWASVLAMIAAACGLAGVALAEQRVTSVVRTWLEYARPGPPSFTGGYPTWRSGSLFAGSLEYAFYSAALLPVAVATLVASRRWLRWAAVLVVLMVTTGLVITFTRSALLGGAIGLAVVLALTARSRGMALGGLAVGAAAVTVLILADARGVGPLGHGGSDEAHLSRVR